MPERLGPYEVLHQERGEAFLSVWKVRNESGEGRLYWFEVREPEARAAFFRFRKALRVLASLNALPKGVEISAKPGLYYVFWPAVSAPSALPAKGRKVVIEVGRILSALAPLGYALPDLDLRLGEAGIVVGGLDPLAEHDEAEAARLGGRFLKGLPAGRNKQRSRPRLQAWLPGLLLGLLGTLLIIAAANRYLNPPEYVLPDLRGLSAREALEKVAPMGLKVVFSEAGDPNKPRDVVIEQNPEPGVRVKPLHRLELLINRPKEGVVPKLSGLTLEEAQQRLAASGFQPADVKSSHSERPAGTVLATSPPAAAPLPQGEQIKLLVSEGPNTQTTILPNLVSLNLEDAKYLLSVAELRVGDVQKIPSPEPEGTVLSQSPPAGSELAVGSPVTLTVATRSEVLIPKNTLLEPELPPSNPEGNAAPTKPEPVAKEEAPAPGERIVPIRVSLPNQSNQATVHVRLEVTDENGTRTPIDTYAPVGTALEGSVKVKGTAHFKLYLNGFLYQQWDSQAP
ncbi:PASTA domain-containing protein [Oceanithermus sp.]